MRHKEEIERILAEALDKMAPDPRRHHTERVRTMMNLVEQRGAYPILANQLQKLGRYRLADCTDDELSVVLCILDATIAAHHARTVNYIQVPGRAHRAL